MKHSAKGGGEGGHGGKCAEQRNTGKTPLPAHIFHRKRLQGFVPAPRRRVRRRQVHRHRGGNPGGGPPGLLLFFGGDGGVHLGSFTVPPQSVQHLARAAVWGW